MFFYWGFWKWEHPVHSSAEGMALLVAGKYIKNNAVPARHAWSDVLPWLRLPLHSSLSSGPHPAVLTPLKEAWGISAASNLKTSHKSKRLQDQTRQGKSIQTYVSVYRVGWSAVAAMCPYGLSIAPKTKMMLRAFQTSPARKPLRLQRCRRPCW